MSIETRIPEPLDLPMAGGDDFAGWGRVQKIVTGDAPRTICEGRLMQRWAGSSLGRSDGSPRDFLRSLIRALGTDAPSCNNVFLRCDRPDCNVVATIEYGSGSGNEQFQVSVGAGTNVFIPGTFWRVSLASEVYTVGGALAPSVWPPDGIEVLVQVNVGRGTGAQNTRPTRTLYTSIPAVGTARVPIPARSIGVRLHTPTAFIGNVGLLQANAPGGFNVAEWRPPQPQDLSVPILPGATDIDVVNIGAAVDVVLTFELG